MLGTTTLLASLALAGGGAEERICHGQLRPPSRLQRAIDFRREYGLRSDRDWVRRLVRTRRTSQEWDSPLTRRERRYFSLRNRLRAPRAVDVYLARRPGLSGGISIEGDYPTPYLHIRVTRDRAVHEPELRRLYPFPDRNLRVSQVQFSYDELLAAQDRIDWDALEADDFDVTSTWPDIDTNRLIVALITKRTDHVQVFAARYGPAVMPVVIATEQTALECTKADAYRPSADGRSLRVLWTTGGGARFERIELMERRGRVEIGIVERVPNGPRTSEGIPAGRTVRLSRPLGGRRVVDAATGKTLRRGRRHPYAVAMGPRLVR